MKVRAVAVAAEDSNAIGTVEVECTPYGLVISYLGVGAFTEGYAPGALTSGTRVTVPWPSIELARLEGQHVFLSLDPAFTPHSRMTLGNFWTGDAVHPRELLRQRTILRLATVGGAMMTVLLMALLVPRAVPEATGAAAVGIGVASAAVVLLLGLFAERRVSPQVDGSPARDLFVFDLANYLPALVRVEQSPRPPPKPITWPLFQGILPRTTFAVVLTLSACGLSAVLMAKWIIEGGRELRERERAHAAETREKEREELEALTAMRSAPEPRPAAAAPPPPPAAPPPASAAAPPVPVATAAGACRCQRGDTALWRDPIPRLSTVVLSSRVIQKRNHPEIELELSAINNSDQDIRELELQIDFFEKDPAPSNKRHHVDHRVVYFAGPLTPGQAIKWRVEADGAEFEVKSPIQGDIGPGGDGAAPVSRFAELLDANHRPVRLHGAMMLAYLGDARAKEAALKLRDALREDEAPYLRRILQSVGEVQSCRLTVTESGPVRRVSSCVFNASAESKADLALRVNGFAAAVNHLFPTAAPPLIVSDATFRVPAPLPPGQGVVVTGEMDVSKAEVAPIDFEAYADRADLLQ